MLKAVTYKHKDLLFAAGVILLGWVLWQAGEVLLPFVLAGLFAFALNPVVTMLSHYVRLPRTLSILVIYLLILGLVTTFIFLIFTRAVTEIRQISTGTPVDVKAQEFISSLPIWEIGGQKISLPDYANRTLDNLSTFTSGFESKSLTIFSSALREGIYFAIFLVTGFYLLRDGRKIKTAIVALIPELYREDFLIVWGKLQVVLANYLRGQLLLMLIIGSLSYAVLETLGVRYAVILAIIAGFLEVVPMVGPILAATLAVSVSFLTGDNRFGLETSTLSLVVLGSYVVIQQLENYIIVPNLYYRLIDLHPALVIFAIIVGGSVFGLLGAVLAVPTAASIKVIAKYLADKG